MEAKDRITKTNEENCHNTLEERLAEQDKVSFKAGVKEVVEWIKQSSRVEQSLISKWIDGAIYRTMSERGWQAKLKEWGIE